MISQGAHAMKRMTGWCVAAAMGLCVGLADAAPVTGSLSNIGTETGLTATHDWIGTIQIDWSIEQQTDGSWFYEYTFSDGQDGAMPSGLSHFILAVSTTAESSDFSDFSSIVNRYELAKFEEDDSSLSNPNLPGTIDKGLKSDLDDPTDESAPIVVSFVSTRQPMWTDIFGKSGRGSGTSGQPKPEDFLSFHNTDFGVTVADPNDFLNPAVDVNGNALAKILAPNTIETTPPPSTQPVPTPAAAMLIAWIGTGLVLRRPTHRG